MAVYRDKYILEGLDSIDENMQKDLDLAYDVCKHMHDSYECTMCGKCCRQPNITVMDREVERIAGCVSMNVHDFENEYLYREDGRWLFRKTDACRFLNEDNKCAIWKERPEICRDFPYMVSKFMSRVYLSIVNNADIDLSYMDDDWPCTSMIRDSIHALIKDAREKRITRSL
ncbi:MAG: YkgJ family cysteine cluster protein [Methanomassiliicoccaceae archaeon]|nr:YkgJ family cysteine cluster protein [Methanomassiliicoccaceae archaeon]